MDTEEYKKTMENTRLLTILRTIADILVQNTSVTKEDLLSEGNAGIKKVIDVANDTLGTEFDPLEQNTSKLIYELSVAIERHNKKRRKEKRHASKVKGQRKVDGGETRKPTKTTQKVGEHKPEEASNEDEVIAEHDIPIREGGSSYVASEGGEDSQDT